VLHNAIFLIKNCKHFFSYMSLKYTEEWSTFIKYIDFFFNIEGCIYTGLILPLT